MLNIITVPAFSDNYIWLFHRPDQLQAYVVDPGDAAPVEDALRQRGLTLAGILITHHHPDHVGGVGALCANRDIPVYGPADTPAGGITHPLTDGQQLSIEGLAFEVIGVPGHTLDHIAFYAPEADVLFCGDTLFAGGCGRLFEGTPEQMHASLVRLTQLPARTQVYCAHEYTQANLAFARAVEPDNQVLQQRQQETAELRAEQRPTVPTTLSRELETNPFLRTEAAAVARSAREYSGKPLAEPWQVFAALRQWKDNF